VLEHGPVDLLEQIRSNLDDEIRPDPEREAVVRRVMDLAEREPGADGGDSRLLPVRHDVGRVEQLLVSQRAHGAPLLVRP
jgi:hypothetical protein